MRRHNSNETNSESQGEEEPLTFGKYRDLRKIGEGGYGAVYKAYDPDLDRTVALKLFKFSARFEIEQFKREAKLAAKLQHPNIITIYEFGILENQAYYTMDFVEGKTLRELLKEKGRLPAKEVLRVAIVLSNALSFAHSNGILHRDVKPGNVFLDEEGRIYLSDFGIAKEFDVTRKQATASRIVGTPHYMSPEQAEGRKLDARSDIWSLGVLIYEMLCGGCPFTGDTGGELFRKIWYSEPTPPRKISPELGRDIETIVLKCLEKEPGRRYASAAELKGDIERYVKGDPIKARPIAGTEQLRRWLKRNKAVSVGVAVALLAVITLAAILAFQSAAGSAKAVQLLQDAKREFENLKYERALGIVSESLALVSESEEAQELRSRCEEKIQENKEREAARQKAEAIVSKLPLAANLVEQLQLLDDAIATDLTWLLPHIEKGKLLKNAGRGNEAVEVFERATNVACSNNDKNGEAVCHFYTGMVCWERKEPDRALPHFNKVLQLMPNVRNPMTLYTQAAVASYNGQYDRAIRLLDKAVQLEPNFTEAYNDRGVIREAIGEVNAAVADYTKVIELNPNYVNAFYNRGNARLATGQFDEAVSDYTKVIELDSQYVDAFIGRANAFHGKRDYAKAIEDCDKAIQLTEAVGNRQKAADVYSIRGNARYAKGDYDGAIADCSKAISLNPNLTRAFYNRGIAKAKKGDHDGAITDYDEAIRLSPNDAEAFSGRALARIATGDYDNALADCRKAIGLNPQLWQAWAFLAKVCSIKHDRKNCLDALKNLFCLNPQLRNWARSDKSFDWLRDDREFKRLLGK